MSWARDATTGSEEKIGRQGLRKDKRQVYTLGKSSEEKHERKSFWNVLVLNFNRREVVSTIVIFKENSNSEGADLVFCAGGEGRVDGTHDAQRLHDQSEYLRAELGSQLHQSLQDAGEERLQDMGALWQLQLITVPAELIIGVS